LLRRAILALTAVPAAIILITLAVTNKHPVKLILDPFRPDDPAAPSITLPLFVYLIAMLIGGVMLGGLATWWNQGKWRRTARTKAQDSLRWQAEADRLTRERDEHYASGRGGAADSAGSQGSRKSVALLGRR